MKKKEVASIRRVPSWFRVRSVATLVLAVAASGAICSSARADLITSFNFNSSTSGTAGSGNVIYNSTAGQTSTITTNFTTSPSIFGGTTVNAVNGDAAGGALAPLGGTATTVGSTTTYANNGDYLQFSVTGTNLANFNLSYATQRSGTGFTTQTLSYSTDGVTFTDVSAVTPPAAFAAESFDLTGATTLNNATTDYFRLTFTGATAASGNNRIDNLQVTTVPEPTTVLGGLLLLVGAGWSQRRRLADALGLVA